MLIDGTIKKLQFLQAEITHLIKIFQLLLTICSSIQKPYQHNKLVKYKQCKNGELNSRPAFYLC